MKKSISRLCLELSYIILSSVGVLLSTHLFTDHTFSKDFYVYYTNLTNYFCLGVMIYCFVKNFKALNGGEEYKPTNIVNNTKVVAGILVCITFLVFNILLADFSLNNYFFNLYNILFHIVLPVWFLIYCFSTCKHVNFWLPFIAFALQSVYVGFVFIRAIVLEGEVGRIIFPYFFLNFQTLGIVGTAKWLFIMFLSTMICGYSIVFVLWLKNRHKKTK